MTASFVLRETTEPDLWFDLRAGADILAGKFTSINLYSYTEPNHVWFNTHWLYDVILFLAVKLGGIPLALVLKFGFWMATICMLWSALDGFKHPAASLIALAPAVVASFDRMDMRSESVSFFFMAFYIYALAKWNNPDNKKKLWWLIPAQILWTNAHLYWIFGIGLLAARTVGAWLAEAPLPFDWKKPISLDKDVRKRLTLVFAICCAVTVLNPYGIAGVFYPIGPMTLMQIKHGTMLHELIVENRGPFLDWGLVRDDFLFSYVLIIVIAVASSLRNFRRINIVSLGVATVFFLYSLNARRGVSVFAFTAAPLIAGNIALILRRMERPLAAAMTAIVIAVSIWAFSGRLWAANMCSVGFGLDSSPYYTPFGAKDFLKKNPLSGNVYNSLNAGAFISYNFPETKIFIDGRHEAAYSESLLYEYLSVLFQQDEFDKAVSKYGIGWVMLDPNATFDHELASRIAANPAWKLVYLDWTSIIFARRDLNPGVPETNLDAFNGVLPDNLKKKPWGAVSLGIALQLLGRPHQAEKYFRLALEIKPDDPTPMNLLGKLLFQTGAREEGLKYLEAATKTAPRHLPFQYDLATAYLMMERANEALPSLERYIKASPESEDARLNLAAVYIGLNRKNDAIAQYEIILKKNPSNRNAKQALDYIRNKK